MKNSIVSKSVWIVVFGKNWENNWKDGSIYGYLGTILWKLHDFFVLFQHFYQSKPSLELFKNFVNRSSENENLKISHQIVEWNENEQNCTTFKPQIVLMTCQQSNKDLKVITNSEKNQKSECEKDNLATFKKQNLFLMHF